MIAVAAAALIVVSVLAFSAGSRSPSGTKDALSAGRSSVSSSETAAVSACDAHASIHIASADQDTVVLRRAAALAVSAAADSTDYVVLSADLNSEVTAEAIFEADPTDGDDDKFLSDLKASLAAGDAVNTDCKPVIASAPPVAAAVAASSRGLAREACAAWGVPPVGGYPAASSVSDAGQAADSAAISDREFFPLANDIDDASQGQKSYLEDQDADDAAQSISDKADRDTAVAAVATDCQAFAGTAS